jgi:hypothetical protein
MGAGNSGPKYLDPINIPSMDPPVFNTNTLIHNRHENFRGGRIRIYKDKRNSSFIIIIIMLLLFFIIYLFLFSRI